MKIFFFLLLFINISLFLWEHNMALPGKEDSRKAGNQIDPSVEKIVLVSEAQQPQTNSAGQLPLPNAEIIQDRKDSTEDLSAE